MHQFHAIMIQRSVVFGGNFTKGNGIPVSEFSPEWWVVIGISLVVFQIALLVEQAKGKEKLIEIKIKVEKLVQVNAHHSFSHQP